MTEPQAEPKITEEEVKRVMEALDSGVFPVANFELSEAIRFIEILADTITKLYADKSINKQDFENLHALWDQAWVLHEKFDAMSEEAKNIGLFGKVSLIVHGFMALNRLFGAIKRVRKQSF